jgi:hypothetical protein
LEIYSIDTSKYNTIDNYLNENKDAFLLCMINNNSNITYSIFSLSFLRSMSEIENTSNILFYQECKPDTPNRYPMQYRPHILKRMFFKLIFNGAPLLFNATDWLHNGTLSEDVNNRIFILIPDKPVLKYTRYDIIDGIPDYLNTSVDSGTSIEHCNQLFEQIPYSLLSLAETNPFSIISHVEKIEDNDLYYLYPPLYSESDKNIFINRIEIFIYDDNNNLIKYDGPIIIKLPDNSHIIYEYNESFNTYINEILDKDDALMFQYAGGLIKSRNKNYKRTSKKSSKKKTSKKSSKKKTSKKSSKKKTSKKSSKKKTSKRKSHKL